MPQHLRELVVRCVMAENPKILVVDDEPVIIASATKTLGAEGYAVRSANTAESALELVRADTPDIVLIDLKLPMLSGLELLETIKKDFPQIKAIVMTGYTTEENARAAIEHGAVIFLPKPFSFEELLSAVERAGRFVKEDMKIRNP